MSQYTYGVEIEVTKLHEEIANTAMRFANVPLNLDYNYKNKNKWFVTNDDSICDSCADYGYGDGAEIVSRILTQRSGPKEIQRVCGALKTAGAGVNRTCGLHVHVGIKNSNKDYMSELCDIVAKRYDKYETEIDKFVKAGRRKDKNDFCGSIKKRYNDRYCKVNSCAIERHGTIEFRHHHGTIDPNEINNWVEFVINFVKQSEKMLVKPSMKDPGLLTGLKPKTLRYFRAKLRA
jgi:hypothetical protein